MKDLKIKAQIVACVIAWPLLIFMPFILDAQSTEPYDTTSSQQQGQTAKSSNPADYDDAYNAGKDIPEKPKTTKVKKGTGRTVLRVASVLARGGAEVAAKTGHYQNAIILDGAATAADVVLQASGQGGTYGNGGYYSTNPPSNRAGGNYYTQNR